ncbi:MAG: UvrD-helicase domain-containing protein [Syntrophobacterales bacterium]|jgi:superfamily I DNA/RNA helicase|nr:UvrD-helicase domain-containing protein [Syntrophobacterales bacterium]
MSRLLEGLNEEQRQAAITISGPVLVSAGPGTGKTLTIVRRIAYLVDHGVRPEEIIAVTFTNRAAREMRERVDEFMGSRASGMFIGTFHLLGLRIIKENLKNGMAVCDRRRQIDILEPLSGGRRRAEQMAEAISRIKSLMEEPQDMEVSKLCKAYDDELRRQSLYDFDDLIRIPLAILDDEAVAAQYKKVFRYVMVDEYQDINQAQHRLTRRLTDGDSNICAVGDPDQAIYAFRGADMKNFLNFETDFPGASMITLTRNYRSSKTILDAASGVIRHNRERPAKNIEAIRARGMEITVISAPDERREAEIIVKEIESRMGGTSHYDLMKRTDDFDCSDGSCGFLDFAVIFRTNSQVKVLEEAFFESGMPYRVVRGEASAGIKQVAEALKERADESLSVLDIHDFVIALCEEKDVTEDDLAFLCQITYAYGSLPASEAIDAVLNELVLLSTGDGYDSRAQAITLMTMHAAKGLEFKVVFIAGVEDGLIPFGIVAEKTEIEEERRLFYVGMTRAKDELLLTRARSRFLRGRRNVSRPSPFLLEIPKEFIKERVVEDKRLAQKQRQMKLF